jgi:hypothetical protein
MNIGEGKGETYDLTFFRGEACWTGFEDDTPQLDLSGERYYPDDKKGINLFVFSIPSRSFRKLCSLEIIKLSSASDSQY